MSPLLDREDLVGGGDVGPLQPGQVAFMDRLTFDVVLSPGVVGLKAGGFLAALELRGDDVALAEPEAVTRMDSALTAALEDLGSGYVLHFETLRYEAAPVDGGSGHPDPWSRAVEARRRGLFGSEPGFRIRTVLYLAYHTQKVDEWIAGVDGLSQFEDHVGAVVRSLESTFAARRLVGDALLSALFAFVNHEPRPAQVAIEGRDGVLLDQALSGSFQRFEPDHAVINEDRVVVPVGLFSFPPEAHAGVMEGIARVQGSYRIVQRLIPLERGASEAALSKKHFAWQWPALDWGALFRSLLKDKDAAQEEGRAVAYWKGRRADVEEAQSETAEGLRFVSFTWTVFAYAPTLEGAKAQAEEIRGVLRDQGFRADLEIFNVPEALFAAIPGNGTANLRVYMERLPAAVGVVPKGGIEHGSPTCPHPRFSRLPALGVVRTSRDEPFFLNVHKDDVGHAIVVGGTGTGKSVFLNWLMWAIRRYLMARVIGFDIDQSLRAQTVAAGGDFYALSPSEGRVGMAPLAKVGDGPERLMAGVEFVEELLHQQKVEVDHRVSATVRRAVEQVARVERQFRTLSTLATKLSDRDLRAALEVYMTGGTYGHLFDGIPSEQENALGPMTVFELRKIIDRGPAVSTPVLVHLFHEVMASLGSSHLTFLAVEEGHRILGNGLFAQRVEDALRTYRKFNGSVFFVTQTPEEILDSAISGPILGASRIRFFCPDGDAVSVASRAEAYEQMGLGPRQREALAAAKGKRVYMVYDTTAERAQMFSLDLSPLELAVMGVAGADPSEAMASMVEAEGMEAWLRHCGVAEEQLALYRRAR